MKTHKITIEVTEKELNALEYYCTVDYQSNTCHYEKDRKLSLSVWQKLVDSIEGDMNQT